jgi:hypothetical protein
VTIDSGLAGIATSPQVAVARNGTRLIVADCGTISIPCGCGRATA